MTISEHEARDAMPHNHPAVCELAQLLNVVSAAASVPDHGVLFSRTA
jgi:hypothetical protein